MACDPVQMVLKCGSSEVLEVWVLLGWLCTLHLLPHNQHGVLTNKSRNCNVGAFGAHLV